jgi:hypothetical protein
MVDKLTFPYLRSGDHDNHGNRETLLGVDCTNGQRPWNIGFDKLKAWVNADSVSFTREGVEVTLGEMQSPLQTRCEAAKNETGRE